jgi:Domain of unknown function (DUF1839)
VSRYLALPGLDAAHYQRHPLHAEDRVWVEKNCYVDVWIELLHAAGVEPLAMLPFTVAVDFEGDQWTFFKPPHEELRELYGVDVQELNVWRPLVEHALEYLAAGKLISTEADAFWLPDTSGTDYRRQHTKSTIILADLAVENRRLGYFHNAGYFALEGEDFTQTFRLGFAADPTFMPLFAESVRLDKLIRRPHSELIELSRTLWQRHLRRLPDTNPVIRFRERLELDLPRMQERGLNHYHAWAFATVRQLGAAFELAALNLRWMQNLSVLRLDPPAAAFEAISTACKTFILKGARAVNGRRPLDVREMLDAVAEHWDHGTHSLAALL